LNYSLKKLNLLWKKPNKALSVLDDNDIFEVKKMNNPPGAVVMTLEAVLIYLKVSKLDWGSARSVMNDK
jgi:hypothetical protein